MTTCHKSHTMQVYTTIWSTIHHCCGVATLLPQACIWGLPTKFTNATSTSVVKNQENLILPTRNEELIFKSIWTYFKI